MSVFSAYSEYYDLLYRDKDYAGESRYVLGRLRQSMGRRPNSILELGCGTGKHAELFYAEGLKVTGVDLSATMIEQARNRLPGGTFVEGDVRTVRLGSTFESVVSLFHVASYQTTNDDILAFLKTAAAHLEPGGVFLFDFWYGPAVYTQQPAVRVKRMENDRVSILRTAEPVHWVNDCMVEVHYEVIVEDRASGRAEHIKEKHSMRYFFLPELRTYLDQAGFDSTSTEFEEWITRASPGPDSWGVTAVARKL
jgi:SAM-dependent methyltransferase